ncbi:MAG: hypothetical protein JW917_06215 [Ignavibacteria bacterium]|nr:hypothetical protein [Ignavibacteria bacterium]
MRKVFLLGFLVFLSVSLYAQDKQEGKFGISFSGFVKADFFADSRQVTSIREGHFLLFPENELLDKNGEDINAKPHLNFLSVQTRVTGKITGPDFLDAKTSGLIEAEFFGTSDADVNGLRLRHAFVKLDWTNTSFLAGQFWNPMFIVDCFPGTISFNTGVPFQPFARNPQLRFTQKFDNLSFTAVAYSQRDFQSNGPDGFSSKYLRNAVLPGLHGQLRFEAGDNAFGLGGGYKMLAPRISTAKNYKSDETVGSLSALVFGKFKFNDVLWKIEGVYGQNMTDLTMLGGYGVKSLDTNTGIETYTNINTVSAWTDISYTKNIEVGIFAGVSMNLGADDNFTAFYGRGGNIDNLFRVSPRFAIISGKTKIAAELEFTSAAYGTVNYADKGKVENTKSVTNIRGLLAFIYNF